MDDSRRTAWQDRGSLVVRLGLVIGLGAVTLAPSACGVSKPAAGPGNDGAIPSETGGARGEGTGGTSNAGGGTGGNAGAGGTAGAPAAANGGEIGRASCRERV